MWIAALLFHGGLIGASYWVGRDRAAYGVALFLIGAVAFQMLVLGPASILEPSGCDYSSRVKDC